MTEIAEAEVIRAAQAVQRAYRETRALLSDVADAVVTQDANGNAIAHLPASLIREIRRVTNSDT